MKDDGAAAIADYSTAIKLAPGYANAWLKSNLGQASRARARWRLPLWLALGDRYDRREPHEGISACRHRAGGDRLRG